MDLLGMSKIQDNLQNPNRKLIGKMLFFVYAGIKRNSSLQIVTTLKT